MNEQNSRPPLQSEIDIIKLFRTIFKGIGNFFLALFNFFLFLFVFGIRRFHWVLVGVIVGGLAGYILYVNTERFYVSEMVAQPNGFTSLDMIDYINDIHVMCKTRNTTGLTNSLGIDLETAEQIKNIDAYHYIDVNKDGYGDVVDYKRNYNPLNTNKQIIMSRVLIRAEVFDPIAFDRIETGILKYIDNNNYLITVNSLRKEELRSLIKQADQEIVKLDSLQNYEYYMKADERRDPSREGQLVFMNEKPTQLYYQDKVSLLLRKLDYQKSLELATNPITIIKEFPQLDIEENPVSKYLIIAAFFGGFTGYLLLILLYFRKRILDYISKSV